MKYTNRLIEASSPYLLQHAHNPVNWMEWSEEAWSLAKSQDKLVLVSVGYAACHWCHVMEHECFEDDATAGIMNEHFICIKVDREERPDVDAVYMDACQLITQRGGWPLNVFCLPDGRPIHAGTYFPKAHWDDMLKKLAQFYIHKKNEAITYAEKLVSGINQLDIAALAPAAEDEYQKILKQTLEKWQTMFDPVLGGYNWAPKFPMPSNYECMLHIHSHTCNPILLFQVENTLKKMALGGINDQLGGGFARYSVDSGWKVPHFEKMLYDNAQLISLYSHAYQLNKKPFYIKTIDETIQFVCQELMHPNGLFYSSLDADSEGIEGKYYVWTKNEIEYILKADADLFCKYFRVNEEGLWEEDNNILLANETIEEFAEAHHIYIYNFKSFLQDCKNRLLAVRGKRIKPGLDDKIICSWNALMIKGLCHAYQATNNKEYIQLAKNSADNLLSELYINKKLHRIWKNGKISIPAFAEDYAFLSEALLTLYQTTFDEKYIYISKQLVDESIDLFVESKTGFFHTESRGNQTLFADKMDITDDVISSANSVFANVLFRLGYYFSDQTYIQRAENMLHQVAGKFEKFPTGYANWMDLLLLKQYGLIQIVFTQIPGEDIRTGISGYYIPNVIYACAGTLPLTSEKKSDIEKIYVCKGQTCYAPVSNFIEAKDLIFGKINS